MFYIILMCILTMCVAVLQFVSYTDAVGKKIPLFKYYMTLGMLVWSNRVRRIADGDTHEGRFSFNSDEFTPIWYMAGSVCLILCGVFGWILTTTSPNPNAPQDALILAYAFFHFPFIFATYFAVVLPIQVKITLMRMKKYVDIKTTFEYDYWDSRYIILNFTPKEKSCCSSS